MGRCVFSSDDIVVKSASDRRLYRVIQLENGLTALIVHDPEIYPDGPPQHSEAEDMECEDDDCDGEESEDCEDEDEEDEDDEEDEGEEDNEVKGKGKGVAAQTKKVCLLSFTLEICNYPFFFLEDFVADNFKNLLLIVGICERLAN